jgi:hypothetical protein
MLDCWSLIWLWTCCIYVHLWFWCLRFEVPLSIDINIFSIRWFRFRYIDFSLSVSFSSVSFPYRFRVKKICNAYFRSFPTDFNPSYTKLHQSQKNLVMRLSVFKKKKTLSSGRSYKTKLSVLPVLARGPQAPAPHGPSFWTEQSRRNHLLSVIYTRAIAY